MMTRMPKFFLYLFALASVLVMPFGAAEAANINPDYLLGAWINGGKGDGNSTMLQFFDDGTMAAIPIAYPRGSSPQRTGAFWANYDLDTSEEFVWYGFKLNGGRMEISKDGEGFVCDVTATAQGKIRFSSQNEIFNSEYVRVFDYAEMDRANKYHNAINEISAPDVPEVTADYLIGYWIGPMKRDGRRELLRIREDGRWRKYVIYPPDGDDTLAGYPGGWKTEEANFTEGRYKFVAGGEVRFRRLRGDGSGYENGYASIRAVSGDIMEEYSMATSGDYSDGTYGKISGFSLYRKVQ